MAGDKKASSKHRKTNFAVFHSSRWKLPNDIQIRFGKKAVARASTLNF